MRKFFYLSFLSKHGFLGPIFASRFVFFYYTPLLSTSGTLLLWDGVCQTAADFWDDKIFFCSFFLFEVKIITLNLRCYLLVVLCLISLHFASRSMALLKHVVSDVIKRLSTFASYALSILASMLFVISASIIFIYIDQNYSMAGVVVKDTFWQFRIYSLRMTCRLCFLALKHYISERIGRSVVAVLKIDATTSQKTISQISSVREFFAEKLFAKIN